VAYISNRVLFSQTEEWNYVMCMNVDGTEDHRVEWNKPDWERQIPHDLSHMYNLDLKESMT
jgi:hypothetical protein